MIGWCEGAMHGPSHEWLQVLTCSNTSSQAVYMQVTWQEGCLAGCLPDSYLQLPAHLVTAFNAGLLTAVAPRPTPIRFVHILL